MGIQKAGVLFLVITCLISSLFAQEALDFREAKGTEKFKNFTLLRRIRTEGDQAVVVVYKYSSEKNSTARVRTVGESMVPLQEWENSSLFSPVAKENLKINANGSLSIFYPRLSRTDTLQEAPGVILTCKPEELTVKQEVDAIFAKARGQPSEPPEEKPHAKLQEPKPELNKKVFEILSPEEQKERAEKIRQIREELLEDLEFVRDLNLQTRFDFADRAELAKAKAALISEFYQKIREDYDFKDIKQSAEATFRANRLFVALTLYGEFGGDRDRKIAHLYWASRVMERRANNNLRTEGFVIYDEEAKSNVRWLEVTPAGACLANQQFSCLNTTDPNLVRILKPEVTGRSLKEISTFVAEYDQGIWEVVGDHEPLIDHYDSPRSLADYAPGYIDKKTKKWVPPVIPAPRNFRAVDLPAIQRNDMEKSPTYIVDPLAFRGGTMKVIGKKK